MILSPVLTDGMSQGPCSRRTTHSFVSVSPLSRGRYRGKPFPLPLLLIYGGQDREQDHLFPQGNVLHRTPEKNGP